MTTLLLGNIKVNQRHRTDLGDIKALADSMTDLGQLQPVVVTSDYTLVAGQRRIVAARSLGWTEIDVTVVRTLDDATLALRAERDENTCRKAFAQTEEHALYEALLELERPKAEARAKAGTPVKVSQGSGRAKATAAQAATGSAGRARTLDKVGAVKAIASDESQPAPVRKVAQDALAEMDRTGKVDAPYQRTRAAKAKAAPDFRPDPVAEVKRQPAVVAGRTIERLELVTKGIRDAAGGVDAILADLDDSQLDQQVAASWLASLDIAIPLLEAWRAGLRRRNLRSVK